MRKEEKLLKAFSDVKEEYIDEVSFEENEQPQIANKTKKTYWVRWVGLAASIALLVFGGMHFMRVFGPFDRFDLGTEVAEEENANKGNENEENIVVDIERDKGFSVVTSSSEDITVNKGTELISKNPWNKDATSLSYPLYKNMAYVSAAGIPAYFSEVELLTMAEDAAEKLGATLTDWEYSYVEENGVEKLGDPYLIRADSDIATIEVWGNGDIKIFFYESVPLPNEYLLTDDKDIIDAEAATNYLIEEYKDLLDAETLVPDCYLSYDLQGNRTIHYRVYGQSLSGNPLADYCFSRMSFVGDENGNLSMILYSDARRAASYVGEGLVVTEEVARNRLYEGMYYGIQSEEFTIGGRFSDENIAKVELIYMTGSVCEYFLPYYCFYVETEGGSETTTCYSAFYVPALTDEYLDNFPEVNPIGN